MGKLEVGIEAGSALSRMGKIDPTGAEAETVLQKIDTKGHIEVIAENGALVKEKVDLTGVVVEIYTQRKMKKSEGSTMKKSEGAVAKKSRENGEKEVEAMIVQEKMSI